MEETYNLRKKPKTHADGALIPLRFLYDLLFNFGWDNVHRRNLLAS